MYLDNIISYINSTVKLRMGSKAARAKFYGMCKIVDRDGTQAVIEYDNQGSDVNIQDDTYHLIVYHRFLGFVFQSNEINAKDSYGDGASTKSAYANFLMGVYGNRKFLDLTDQELTASICFNFPDEMPPQLLSQLTGAMRVLISPISTNNDKHSEPLQPESENIFFTVNYRAAITGDVACLSQCNPDCA